MRLRTERAAAAHHSLPFPRRGLSVVACPYSSSSGYSARAAPYPRSLLPPSRAVRNPSSFSSTYLRRPTRAHIPWTPETWCLRRRARLVHLASRTMRGLSRSRTKTSRCVSTRCTSTRSISTRRSSRPFVLGRRTFRSEKRPTVLYSPAGDTLHLPVHVYDVIPSISPHPAHAALRPSIGINIYSCHLRRLADLMSPLSLCFPLLIAHHPQHARSALIE